MHLEAGRIEEFLHGELGAEDRAELVRHLAACSTCREAVARARRDDEEIDGLLALGDHPVPTVAAEELIVRARAQRRGPAWRWAAGLVLGLGIAGAAYAAPGSPLPGWMSGLVRGFGDEAASLPRGEAQQDSGIPGIGVDPGGLLVIDVVSLSPSTTLSVGLGAGTEVEVRGGGDLRFVSNPGRLAIEGSGADTVRIAIPESAPDVQVIGSDGILMTWALGDLVVRGEAVALPAGGTIAVPLDPGL